MSSLSPAALRLPWTFAGVLGKNSFARRFKGKHGKLYIVGKLKKCRFRKKIINCRFLQFRIRESQTTMKMTMGHSIELIGYQIQVHWQNNCKDANQKGSVIKTVSAFFDILTGYFLINLSSSSSKESAMGIALKIATGEIL